MATIDKDLLELAWKVLVQTARAKSTIPYSELARRLGWRPGAEHGIGNVLTALYKEVCVPAGYHNLSALAVLKDKGYPGDAWWGGDPVDMDIWREERDQCWNYAWPDSPWDDSIVKTRGTLSGKPRINGTRIGVTDIWLAYLRAVDEVAIPHILEDFPHLKEGQIRAALDYARKYPQEIEQELDEEEKASKGSHRLG